MMGVRTVWISYQDPRCLSRRRRIILINCSRNIMDPKLVRVRDQVVGMATKIIMRLLMIFSKDYIVIEELIVISKM